MTNKSHIVANAVSIPLAGVSTIACIIALGVLLYYKMWRTFIYRLVLYMFIALIVFSFSNMVFYNIINLLKETNLITDSNSMHVIQLVVTNSNLVIVFMLVTYITVCIYLMALHNYQFTYKSDLFLLVPSIIYLVIVITVIIIWSEFF